MRLEKKPGTPGDASKAGASARASGEEGSAAARAALVGQLKKRKAPASEEGESGDEGVILAQVDENHPQQQLLGVYPMESVGRSRLRDRQWKLMTTARMVGYGEVVCRIYLEPSGLLSTASVEELLARGISV